MKTIMFMECKTSLSALCLKLELVKLIGRAADTSIAILPGIHVTSSGLPRSHLSLSPDKIDALLLDRLSNYIGSLSLSIKLMDKSYPANLAKSYIDDSSVTGRKKKFGGALLAAGLMSAGTMMALGMGALAAMAGKALMASLLALLLAGMSAMGKGGGHTDEKTTYEIVAKPVISHQHTHSSEIQSVPYRRSTDPHHIVYSDYVPHMY